MSDSSDVCARLSAAWESKWSRTPPIAFLLRDLHPDRWIRFHSLPESKRYPETDAEYAMLFRRHHAVLDELGAEGESFVISAKFEDESASRAGSHDAAHPGATYWRTVENEGYLEVAAQLYASMMCYPSLEFEGLLRAAADDEIAFVIVAPPDLRWLYHPYDGGADVIAQSPLVRDRLKEKFSTWLSSHPMGL